MKRFLTTRIKQTAILILLVAVFPSPVAGETIGVYFDRDATSSCIADTIIYPYSVDAYVVVKDVDSNVGIGAWELALTHSATAFVQVATGPNSINFSQPPEYMIALGVPLSGGGAVVLAELQVWVSGPAEFFMSAISEPSISGSVEPVLASGADLNQLRNVDYEFGGPLEPAASIGYSICPSTGAEQQQSAIEDLPLSPAEPSFFTPEQYAISEPFDGELKSGTQQLDVDKLEELWRDSDYCVVGLVESMEVGCLVDGYGVAQGTVDIEIGVLSQYWGPTVEQFRVYVPGVSVDGCVRYPPSSCFELYDTLERGAIITVFANFRTNAVWSSAFRVFPGDVVTPLMADKTSRDQVLRLIEKPSLAAIGAIGEGLALLQPLGLGENPNNDYRFELKQVLVGHDLLAVDDEIVLSFQYGYVPWVGHERSSLLVLCNIEKRGEKFVLVDGTKSIKFLTSEGLRSFSGLLHDDLGLLQGGGK